jgi:UDP-glucose 4-epimerase
MACAKDLGEYFKIPADNRDLNYGKFFEEGEKEIAEAVDYHSHNTSQLDLQGMKKLLMKLKMFSDMAQR